MNYTKIPNLEVESLKAKEAKFGLKESDYKITSADAPTMGEVYTQADMQKLANLANELKKDLNKLVKKLADN